MLRGMFSIALISSASNDGSTLSVIFILDILFLLFTSYTALTTPEIPFSCAIDGYFKFRDK